MRGAFVFDADRCTGCQACELACSVENQLGTDRSWRSVLTFNPGGLPGVPLFHLSLACNHCADPACMHACPADAYLRDAETAAVLIDPARCIGCRYCAWACPYGAPRFEADRGVMGKCTFCSHRIRENQEPACAQFCPTGALAWAVLAEEEMEDRIEGMPATDLGPAIRIRRGTRRELARGQRSESSAGPVWEGVGPGGPVEPTIGAAREWSLLGFTFLSALLFGLVAAAASGVRTVQPIPFAVGAGLAATLSLAHLGRPGRAWRAILNVRTSWLSREVVSFGLFGLLGLLASLAPGSVGGTASGVAAFLVGLALLVSADLVYRPVHRGTSPLVDDGGSLLTGLYFAGLLAVDPWIAGPAAALKLAVVLTRVVRGADPGPDDTRDRGWLLAGRVGLGLLVPLAAWATLGAPLATPFFAAAVGGELLGRAGFYERLRVVSPQRQMRQDLWERVARGGSGSPRAPARSL